MPTGAGYLPSTEHLPNHHFGGCRLSWSIALWPGNHLSAEVTDRIQKLANEMGGLKDGRG